MNLFVNWRNPFQNIKTSYFPADWLGSVVVKDRFNNCKTFVILQSYDNFIKVIFKIKSDPFGY